MEDKIPFNIGDINQKNFGIYLHSDLSFFRRLWNLLTNPISYLFRGVWRV